MAVTKKRVSKTKAVKKRVKKAGSVPKKTRSVSKKRVSKAAGSSIKKSVRASGSSKNRAKASAGKKQIKKKKTSQKRSVPSKKRSRLKRIEFTENGPDKRYVMICPRCGSTRIHREQSNSAVLDLAPLYRCKSCGHFGDIFPEVLKEDVKGYREELKKEYQSGIIHKETEEKIDSHKGVFMVETFLMGVFTMIGLICLSLGIRNYSSDTDMSKIYLIVSGVNIIGAFFMLTLVRSDK